YNREFVIQGSLTSRCLNTSSANISLNHYQSQMDRVSVAHLLIFLLAFISKPCNATSSIWPYQSFHSVNLRPPQLKISRTGPTAQGYLFFSPSGAGTGAAAAMIMSDHESEDTGGRLIWQGPSEPAFGFDVA